MERTVTNLVTRDTGTQGRYREQDLAIKGNLNFVTPNVRNLGLWDQYISECYTQPNQFTSCVSFREVQIVSSPNTTDFDFDFYFLESEELLR